MAVKGGRKPVSKSVSSDVLSTEVHTLLSALCSHHFDVAAPPLKVDFASEICSYSKRNWPDIKLALRGSPVNVLTSITSRP